MAKRGRKEGYKLSEESKKKIGEANRKHRIEYINKIGKEEYSRRCRKAAMKSVESRRKNMKENGEGKPLWCHGKDHERITQFAKRTGRKVVDAIGVIVRFFFDGEEGDRK